MTSIDDNIISNFYLTVLLLSSFFDFIFYVCMFKNKSATNPNHDVDLVEF